MTTLAGGTPSTERSPGRWGARPWYRRPLPAGLALLVAYVALSFLNDTGGTLGTDTGIKVATLKVMEQRGSWIPDIGYWAADLDPEGLAHPFRDARPMGDGFVAATTLPLVYLAYPLWLVGGYRASLLWPMVGAVGAAFVARGLARRLGDRQDGWPAFWLAGLASPLAIYALDLWEHTLGVALMGAGILLLVDVCGPGPTGRDGAVDGDAGDAPPPGERTPIGAAWRGFLAGACFGAAFTMRTEALVYTAVSFAVVCVVLAWRRRWILALATGAAGVAGFVVPALGNAALERAAVGGAIRSSRAAGTAAAGGSGLGERLREGVVTLTSPFPSFGRSYILVGVLGAAALVVAAAYAGTGGDRRRAQLAGLGVLIVVITRLASGLGFWPGMLATTPMAGVGLGRGWADARRRLLLALGLIPVPLVVAFQFTGGALPQWGGRYLLTSGFVLAVVGAVALAELQEWARRGAVGLAVLVTALGIGWLSVRTHQVASALGPVRDRPEDVLIWVDGFLPRELAAIYGEGRWLAGGGPGQLDAAIDVAVRAEPATIGLVTTGSAGEDPIAPVIPGFHRTGTTEVPFLDPVNLIITSYAATAS